MSKEAPTGLSIAEKFLGLLTIIIGAIAIYVTHTNPPAGQIAQFSGIFIAAGFALIALGVCLVLAKAE